MNEKKAVLDANARFYEAFAQRDAEAMGRLWASDAPVSCIHPGGSALIGREDVLASWHEILAGPAAPAVRCEAPEASVHHDTALVVCTERFGSDLFSATNVFVKRRGGWVLVHRQSGPSAEPVRAQAKARLSEKGGIIRRGVTA